MILRPRQEQFVARCLGAFNEHRAVLGVAPTGAGKSVMLSAVAREMNARRVLVLQHRAELVDQNERTFHAVHPWLPTARWTAAEKVWPATGAVFAMVQTLGRRASLEAMRPVDLVVVDEAHHTAAPTWRAILSRARDLNPEVRILGVTATPTRGDGASLAGLYETCADQITLGELISAGHLVPPRAFVLDVGAGDLGGVRRMSTGEYDMAAVEALVDTEVVTSEVIRHWRAQADGRRTVAFCPTVAHAEHLAAAFCSAGIPAASVSGGTTPEARERRMREISTGELRVLTNCMVATEGWDAPPVSCVMLLRPSSYRSTMVQMIGRGLRTVDPRRFPGVAKSDCVVLDFGRSLLVHGGLDQIVDLRPRETGDAPMRACPSCSGLIPISASECPLCAVAIERRGADEVERQVLDRAELVELADLIEASPFRWHAHNERTRVCSGIDAWAVVCRVRDAWHAFGGCVGAVEHLAIGDERQALAAADDYMREHADARAVGKSRRWLGEPATAKQTQFLARLGVDVDPIGAATLGRYEAACLITLRTQRRRIARVLGVAA